jgi:hypothetical protein
MAGITAAKSVTESGTVNASPVARCLHHPLDGKGATLKRSERIDCYAMPSAVARSSVCPARSAARRANTVTTITTASRWTLSGYVCAIITSGIG